MAPTPSAAPMLSEDLTRHVLNLVDRSGIAEMLSEWYPSRRPGLESRSMVAIWLLLACEGKAVVQMEAVRLLRDRLTSDTAELLRVSEELRAHPHESVRRADERLHRALQEGGAAMDAEQRATRMTRFAGRLLREQYRQRRETHPATPLNVAIDTHFRRGASGGQFFASNGRSPQRGWEYNVVITTPVDEPPAVVAMSQVPAGVLPSRDIPTLLDDLLGDGVVLSSVAADRAYLEGAVPDYLERCGATLISDAREPAEQRRPPVVGHQSYTHARRNVERYLGALRSVEARAADGRRAVGHGTATMFTVFGANHRVAADVARRSVGPTG